MGITKISHRMFRLGLATALLVLLSVLAAGIAQAAPPAQDPRPPIGDGGGGGSGGGSKSKGGDKDGGPAAITCASISGEVLNWGFRPEPNVVTNLHTGSWQVTDMSDDDGRYSFGALGIGIAKLDVILAPGEPLQPLIKDAAVHLNCDYPIYANIALFSGSSIEPPVTIEMTASSQVVTEDSETDITVTIENSMPNEITNVIVTSLIHPGLVPVEASAPGIAPENVQIINGGDDGQLMVVFLDTVDEGASAKISLVVKAVEDTPFTGISNAATVFYRESVANQTSIDLTIGSNGLAVPAAIASAQSTASDSAAQPEQRVTRSDQAEETQVETTTQAEPEATTAAGTSSSSTSADTGTSVAPDDAQTTAEEQETSAFAPPAAADDDSLLPKTGDAPELSTSEGFSEAIATGQTNSIIPMVASITLLLGFVAYGLRSARQRTF